MKKKTLSWLVGIAGLAACTWASAADVKFYAGRVGGPDVPALAKFYETAFGLQEVDRLHLPGGNLEIMLNFGDSAPTAKANTAVQIAIMHRAADLTDPVPHLMLNVTDLDAVIKAVQMAGGKIDGKPRSPPNLGVTVAFAVDPAGNRIELLQFAGAPGR